MSVRSSVLARGACVLIAGSGVLLSIGTERLASSEKKPNIKKLVNDVLGREAAYDLTKKLNTPPDHQHPKYDHNPLGLSYKYYFNQKDLKKFKQWIDETILYSKTRNTCAIILDKAAYRLFLFRKGKQSKVMEIELGGNPYDDKKMQGDRATPEGNYFVKRVRWKSQYYRALLIDYPNEQDKREFALLKKKGQIPRKQGIGSAIEIHGHGNDLVSWTWGCAALTNKNMDVLFKDVRRRCIGKGTPVTIVKYGMKNKY